MSEPALPITRTQLVSDLLALGIRPGQALMLHGSVKAVGDVMGGPNTILQAVLDALTPGGTLMMYAGWQDIPDFIGELPDDVRQRYYDEHPAFDPAIARAVRENSILAEFLRTWPGARRSANPEASMVAVGAQADYLTRDHPLNYGYGPGSPLEKLVELQGSVLMLGAPLDTVTLLHYAENRATLRRKEIVRYECPILRDGEKAWVEIEDYNTGEEHDNYTLGEIAEAYLAQGKGQHGTAGMALSYRFDAADLVRFAIHWLEAHFGAET